MWQSASIAAATLREMDLHIGYCKGFGISKEEMEQTEEKEGKQTPFKLRIQQEKSLTRQQLVPHTQGI